MFFPEKLDDRTFRVFVQRTCHLMRKHLALSKTEQQLAMLLNAFPELGFLNQQKDIEINVQNEDKEYNPFLFLAALWQVWQQLSHDSPKGYVNIVQDFFDPEELDNKDLGALASIYLSLYLMAKEKGGNYTEKDYLYEVLYLLQNLDESDIYDEEADYADNYLDQEPSLIKNDMIGVMIDQYMQQMKEEESSKPITLNSGIRALLKNMPVEWVNAISDFWELPEQRLKRDRIRNIVEFLTRADSAEMIYDELEDEKKQLLVMLLDNEGGVKYNVVSKKFGDEKDDSYWWEEEMPDSTIGQLRMMGLIAVGKANFNGRRYKTVIIPKDVRPVVEKVLSL